jgi:hypothetical protein
LLNLWLGELLVGLEGQHVVVHLFSRPVQDYLVLDELILWMLSGKSAVLRNLNERDFTSRP